MWGIIGEIYMVISISVIIIYGSIKRREENIYKIVGKVLIIGGLISMNINEGEEMNMFIEGIKNDGLSKIGKGLIYIMSGLCLIGGKKGKERFEYSVIILLSSFGMGLLISSKDLMTMYLCLEMQSLGLYVLATYSRMGSSYTTESGLKYFIIGGFGSGIMLFGSSLIYGQTGTIKLEEIGELLEKEEEMGKIGLMLVIIGLSFKLSASPFHMWAIDVVEGAMIRTSRYLTVVGKLGVLGIMIRIVWEIKEEIWQDWLVYIGIMSMIVSVSGALYQRRAKRFIGYSGIGHIGYMLMGITVVSYVGEGINNIIMYMMIYMIMNWSIWEIIEKKRIKNIEEIGKKGKENGYIGISIIILSFSMAGIPPLGGFYVKLEIFKGVLEGGMYILGTIGILCTVLGGYNYLRWIKGIYYDKEGRKEERISIIERKEKGEEKENKEEDLSRIVMGISQGILIIYGMYI